MWPAENKHAHKGSLLSLKSVSSLIKPHGDINPTSSYPAPAALYFHWRFLITSLLDWRSLVLGNSNGFKQKNRHGGNAWYTRMLHETSPLCIARIPMLHPFPFEEWKTRHFAQAHAGDGEPRQSWRNSSFEAACNHDMPSVLSSPTVHDPSALTPYPKDTLLCMPSALATTRHFTFRIGLHERQ